MTTDVPSEVNNYTYWALGNKCDASRIYIVVSKNETASNEKTGYKTFQKKEEDSLN